MAEHGGAAPRVACVLADVDFFARVGRTAGEAAARNLAQSLAQQVNQLRGGSEFVGSLGGDRFAVMLPGANEAAAAEWAEKARETLAAETFKVGDVPLKLTASFGVAACEGAERPEELLARAEQALDAAKASGRNCVVTWSQRNAQSSEQLTSQTLFDRTVARDVMTPVTVRLQPQETVAEALALIARTGLEAIPVVDSKGKLAGVCQEAELAEVAEDDGTSRTVGDVLATEVKAFDAHESLSTLLAYFNEEDAPLAVVVDGGRPLGIVTCDSLIVMSRPVEVASLAAAAYADSSEYLLVPDIYPEA
jgi:diguanylate cyclase (GGDEF)-like protein